MDAMLAGLPLIIFYYRLADDVLEGGISSQSITEGNRLSSFVCIPYLTITIVYGEFRTGKTQLAHTMSVMAQLPAELGGAQGKVSLTWIRAFNQCQQLH